MNKEKILDNCQTDPQNEAAEKGFTVSFTKSDGKASISSGIASMVKKAIGHTDIDVETIQVFYEDDESYELMEPEDYSNGRVVGFKGKVPLEAIKIQKKPRNKRAYSNIISGQGEVNINAQ